MSVSRKVLSVARSAIEQVIEDPLEGAFCRQCRNALSKALGKRTGQLPEGDEGMRMLLAVFEGVFNTRLSTVTKRRAERGAPPPQRRFRTRFPERVRALPAPPVQEPQQQQRGQHRQEREEQQGEVGSARKRARGGG